MSELKKSWNKQKNMVISQSTKVVYNFDTYEQLSEKDVDFGETQCICVKLSNFKELNYPLGKICQKYFGNDLGIFATNDYTFNTVYNFGDMYYAKNEEEIYINYVQDNLMFRAQKYIFICKSNFNENGLYIITDNKKIKIGDGIYTNVFEYQNTIYALEKIIIDNKFSLKLHKIQINDKEITNYDLCLIKNSSIQASFVKDNLIYFVDSCDLYTLNLDDFECELLINNVCYDIIVNNIYVNNKTVYIAGQFNLLIANLLTGNIRYFTHLQEDEIDDSWYANEMKLLDIWDKLLK